MTARTKARGQALAVFVTMLLLGVSMGHSQVLSVENQTGEVGERVAIAIRVEGAPNAVDAFGFDVVYDRQVLRYTGNFHAEELVRRFSFFDVSEPASGRLRVGGFTVQNPIAVGEAGQLVTLEFTVVEASRATLTVTNLVDDVAGWAVQAGRFSSVISPATASPGEETSPQPSPGRVDAASSSSSAPPTSRELSETAPDQDSRLLPRTPAERIQGGGFRVVPDQTTKALSPPSTSFIIQPSDRSETVTEAARSRSRGAAGKRKAQARVGNMSGSVVPPSQGESVVSSPGAPQGGDTPTGALANQATILSRQSTTQESRHTAPGTMTASTRMTSKALVDTPEVQNSTSTSTGSSLLVSGIGVMIVLALLGVIAVVLVSLRPSP